jgi:hypothetical protein
MSVVGALELVLDEDVVAVGRVAAEDVGPERPDVHLLGLDLKLNSDRLAEEDHVSGLGQPRCEVAGLADPGFAELDLCQATERRLRSGGHAETLRSPDRKRG